MSTYEWSKSLSAISEEFGLDLKTFKSKMVKYEILLPDTIVFAPYQKWIYEWIGYPPSVNKNDYADTELPLHWMEKCKKEFE